MIVTWVLYLVIFLCLLFFASLDFIGVAKKYSFGMAVFFVVFLTLVAGVRYNTGTDYGTYNNIFHLIQPFYLYPDYAFGQNWGMLWFMQIVKMFGGGQCVYFFLFACLEGCVLYR